MSLGAADPDVSSVTAMQNSAQSWELSEHIREKQGESESPAHLNTMIYYQRNPSSYCRYACP